MNPVITFEGIETNHINADIMDRTVRLVPTMESSYNRTSSYGDLLNALCKAGIKPEQIRGIFKVSAYDNSYSVLMADQESVEQIMSLINLRAEKVIFHIMKMSEQIVTIRIHWLPIYYDNSLLRAIFCDYGKILDINMSRTSHEKLVAFNGVREIRLKTDEIRKQQIPHLIKLRSGQQMLATMPGRPPYCLKCHSIGHIKSKCPPGSSTSFAGLFHRSQAPVRTEQVSAGRSSAAPASETPVGASSGSLDPADVPLPSDESTGGSGSMGSNSGDQQTETSNDVDMEAEKKLKRGRDVVDDDSWIEPNHTARPRLASSHDPLPLSDHFEPIMNIADILSDTDTSTQVTPEVK